MERCWAFAMALLGGVYVENSAVGGGGMHESVHSQRRGEGSEGEAGRPGGREAAGTGCRWFAKEPERGVCVDK